MFALGKLKKRWRIGIRNSLKYFPVWRACRGDLEGSKNYWPISYPQNFPVYSSVSFLQFPVYGPPATGCRCYKKLDDLTAKEFMRKEEERIICVLSGDVMNLFYHVQQIVDGNIKSILKLQQFRI